MKVKNIILATAASALMFSTAIAMAAPADTLFASGVTKITQILTGTGGLLVTLVAIVTAVVTGATGNIKTALVALGVALIASIGPTIATSLFNAVI